MRAGLLPGPGGEVDRRRSGLVAPLPGEAADEARLTVLLAPGGQERVVGAHVTKEVRAFTNTFCYRNRQRFAS